VNILFANIDGIDHHCSYFLFHIYSTWNIWKEKDKHFWKCKICIM